MDNLNYEVVEAGVIEMDIPAKSPIKSQTNREWIVSKDLATPKDKAISSLISCIQTINLKDACIALGWAGKDDDYPKQKHIKVAVVNELIEIAKSNNWQIIHDAGFFYIYNGEYWLQLLDAEVKQILKLAAIRMGYMEIECRDSAFIDKLFQQAEQDGFFTEKNTKKQSIINLQNGSLVLSETGVNLKDFDHRDFITHQLDFAYDPKAVNSVFLAYLKAVLPDADTRKTLQQVTGFLFIKGLKLEKIFFLYGTGANGKSVFFEVLTGVLGETNVSNFSLESLTDDKGYHRAKIKDKVVNYGTDISLNRIDAGMFKTLASGEPIEARLPYCEPFMMMDYAKLIFNVNKMDSASIEHTHGFYRRLLIIPFNKTIPDSEQDADLHKKILADRAGVLNWIIEGAEAVIRNREIFVSKECEQIKAKLLKEADSVAMFVDEQVAESWAGLTYLKTVSQSFSDYRQYAIDSGYKPLGRKNFSQRMEALGFTKGKKEDGISLEKSFLKKVVNQSAELQEIDCRLYKY
jgi:putative DNA primase/helicase